MTPLELDRRDAPESRVTANRVVPAFDELEDRHAGLGLRFETPARKQLTLQRREEALAHRVVVGIAHRSHRGPHLRFLAAKAEGDRGVLRAVVGMMHDAFRPPLPERHVERREHEFGSQVLSHAPADDSATEGIEDHRQVEEPGPRRDVGNVGDPELVRGICTELPLHEIGGRLCITIAHGRGDPFSETRTLQSFGLHEASHTLLAHADACFTQIHVDIGRAVPALGARVVHANASRQSRIFERARRRLALCPCVVAARGDSKHATHRSHRILGLVRRYEPEDFLGVVSASRANQAVAFARISRSTLSLRFSLRRRLSSSRSTLVRTSWRLPPLASACATQLRIVCAVGSNSFASASGLRPDWASSTIFCRNSGGYATRLRGIVDLPYPYIEKRPRKRVNSISCQMRRFAYGGEGAGTVQRKREG